MSRSWAREMQADRDDDDNKEEEETNQQEEEEEAGSLTTLVPHWSVFSTLLQAWITTLKVLDNMCNPGPGQEIPSPTLLKTTNYQASRANGERKSFFSACAARMS